MAVTAYSGYPRSGKSYGVVENVILPALLEGRIVVTNIPLNYPVLYEYLASEGVTSINVREFDLAQAKKDPAYLVNLPGGAVIVIDECWQLWPAGMKASQVDERTISFFAEHGHRVGQDGRTQEIVLVTQDLSQCALFARQLVVETYRAEKLDQAGADKSYRIDIYPGAAIGQNPRGKPIRQIFGKYKESVYKFYVSHTQSETGSAGKEVKVDGRANILKNNFIRFGIPGGIAVVVFSIFAVRSLMVSMFGGDAVAEETPIEKPVQQARVYKPQLSIPQPEKSPAPHTTTPVVPQKSHDGYSSVWRLAGWAEGKNEAGVHQKMAVLVGRGRNRYIPTSDCKKVPGTPEIECQLDGEIVSSWSGQTMTGLGVARVEGAKR
ncbi:MAG: zonular occludens toxin domain-containing protein [Candidatus Sedimenticola sp. (ex Thyasira tokunagai)]